MILNSRPHHFEYMKKENIFEIIAGTIFIIIGVGVRLLPHLPNFTPVAAIGLFGGAYFSKKTSFFLPLAIMVISDIFIGFYDIKLMVAVYAGLALSVLFGIYLKKNKNWGSIFTYSVFASTTFFVLTNFAVWAFSPWYAKDIFGLANCYFMALPFFRNSLMGDLFYTFAFFGAYQSIEFIIKNKFKTAYLKI